MRLEPLRICRVCGLEGHSEEDLELFGKHKQSRHGRQTICKRCSREHKYRTAEFVEVFRARGPDGMKCHFCAEEVIGLEGRNKDSLVIHSLDGDHENWTPENKVPTHHGCHGSHHNTGEGNANWKGDVSKDAIRSMQIKGYTQQRIADEIGRGQPWVSRYLREEET
ncbi:hypothetical protein LCGC14_2294670 [marine sediment metagenome]|uniref:Uncharacterized protein n=1 Tax=marine sediment metagenome TaxID=412755 RepID=A0A0F9DCT4_9ZZZZ